MGADDDAALRGLAEYLGETNYGHSTRCNDVSENLPGCNRGKLVDVAHDQQSCSVRYSFQQCLHQHDIDHRGLIDDQQVAIERVAVIALEAAALRVDLQ